MTSEPLNKQTENTLTRDETVAILTRFFGECVKFWLREETENKQNYTGDINVKQMALQDIANLQHDPYSPNGKPLDKEAQVAWLRQNEYEPKKQEE